MEGGEGGESMGWEMVWWKARALVGCVELLILILNVLC